MVFSRFLVSTASEERSSRRLRIGAAGLIALLVSVASGCFLGPRHIQSSSPPAWVHDLPQDQDHIYAVGFYVGALHHEDNREHALAKARESLAGLLRTRVQSATEVRTRGENQSFRSDTRLETAGDLTEIEHLESWTDVSGVAGPPGQEWVLVRTRR